MCNENKQTKISEDVIMKWSTDDFSNWQTQQENMSKPSPYVFPQMPPQFRRCCAFMKTVFLIQWGCFAVLCICGMVLFIPIVIWGKNTEMSAMIENAPFLAFFIVAFAISLPIFSRLFRLDLPLNFFGGVHVVGIRFRIMFRRVETT